MKKVLISLGAGMALTAAASYLAFRNVDTAMLAATFSSINYLWLLPSVALTLLSYAVRTLRWQIILAPVRRIRFAAAFHPLMAGFMVNCILPGRCGELVRPGVLNRRDGVPFSAVMATVVVERVFDLMILLAMLAGVLAFIPLDPGMACYDGHCLSAETMDAVKGGMLLLLGVLLMGVLVLSCDFSRHALVAAVIKLSSLFTEGSADASAPGKNVCRVISLIENLASGFELVRNPVNVMNCMALSSLVWAVQGASFYLLSLGCPGLALSFTQMFAVMIIICVFISLPSVPGFWGVWEAGGIFGLSLFGISVENAAGFTLVNHAAQIFPVIITGLISAMVTGISWKRVSFVGK